MPDLLDRNPPVANAVTAVVVLGIEPLEGALTVGDFQLAVQRLERAVRPWDTLVNVAPGAVAVHCTALANHREVDAIAARLADVVRAPMSSGDEVRQVGACVGTAVVGPGESRDAATDRASAAMGHMREARRSLVVPPPR